MSELIDNSKQKTEFKTIRVLVTPQLAKRTIEMSTTPQRILSVVRVEWFAKLMKDGLFQCTHQGIALDSENNIIDGWHRLHAVVKSNCSVYMMVSKGVSKDTVIAIDSGKDRGALCRAKLLGRNDTSKQHQIAKILEFGATKSSQMHVPDEILFHIVDKFSEGLSFVTSLKCGEMPVAIQSVVARASYTHDPYILSRFVEVYKTVESASPKEVSAVKLKEAYLKMRGKTNSGTPGSIKKNVRAHIYGLAESALIDFINGFPTNKLRGVEKEHFPLPAYLEGWNG